jgi:hypothetical protein
LSKIGIGFCDRDSAKASIFKWFPYQKGGEFRRWFGNLEYVILWEEDGNEIRNAKDKSGKIPAHAFNDSYIFKPNVSWTKITSSDFSARISYGGNLFDDGGAAIFPFSHMLMPMAGFLNSSVLSEILPAINPTLNIQAWDVGNLPFLKPDTLTLDKINILVANAVELCTQDWIAFEEFWDFLAHPLVQLSVDSSQLPVKLRSLKESFQVWKAQSEANFQELKRLEEENNRYWIDAYGLQDELTPEVPDEQITIRRADLERDIKSLISYAVGCMMGRYSLDAPGLIHAGQPFDPSHHATFSADADGILPITDQAYFDDDIASRFVEFVKVAFGPETLTENLDFIANALKLKSGETAQDRIRRYFVTEFISDHIRTYKKRPIYWLFTSGKKRAFGALVYLHRYTPETVGRIRTDYILELQVKLDKEIERLQAQADAATTTAAKRAATKRLRELQDQQLELRDYQAKVQTFGDQRIALDLDDGVAYNYTRFKGIVYEGTDLKMSDLEKKAQWKLDLLNQEATTPRLLT